MKLNHTQIHPAARHAVKAGRAHHAHVLAASAKGGLAAQFDKFVHHIPMLHAVVATAGQFWAWQYGPTLTIAVVLGLLAAYVVFHSGSTQTSGGHASGGMDAHNVLMVMGMGLFMLVAVGLLIHFSVGPVLSQLGGSMGNVMGQFSGAVSTVTGR